MLTMMTYKIYQLLPMYHTLLFENYDNTEFNIENYKQVYDGNIDAEENVIETLEKIYLMFNLSKPNDFHGHSLSISDVVELDGEKYYVERFGWKKVS